MATAHKQKFASDYAKEFGEKHPNIGEVARGSQLSVEALRQLKAIIGGKASEIERKSLESLEGTTTVNERSFVRTAADMLTRTVYTGAIDYPAALSAPAVALPLKAMQKAAYMSSHEMPHYKERIQAKDLTDPHQAQDTLDAIVGVTQALHTNDPKHFRTHSGNLTDIVNASFDVLSGIALEQGGFPVSTYLEGNLQNMLAMYELVEQKA